MSEKIGPQKSVARILTIAESDIKEARREFKALFGLSYLDRSFDRQVRQLLSRSIRSGEPVQVPLEVGLALVLTRDWRKGGNRKNVAATRGAKQYLYEMAEWLRQRYTNENRVRRKEQRLTKSEIRLKAARDAIRLYGNERIKLKDTNVAERNWNKQPKTFPPLTEEEKIERLEHLLKKPLL